MTTGTNCKKEEPSFTALSHIPCVLKWSRTYISVHGFVCMAELHIPSVLYSSRPIHKNPGSHNTAVSYTACGPRASFIPFIGWKKKLAILFDLSRPGKGQTLWSFRKKCFLYLVIKHKKVHAYAHNFSVSSFSSFDIHQSHHLDGCQPTDKSPSFIFTFWALRFL